LTIVNKMNTQTIYPSKSMFCDGPRQKGIYIDVEDILEIFYGLDPKTVTKEQVRFHTQRFKYLYNPYRFINDEAYVKEQKTQIYNMIETLEIKALALIERIELMKQAGKWKYTSRINKQYLKIAINGGYILRPEYPTDTKLLTNIQEIFPEPDMIHGTAAEIYTTE